MNDTIKLISEYGILIVIAGVFLYIVLRGMKWGMAQVECMKQSHDKATQGFIDTANQFSKVMANHINTSTKATEELTRAVEKLCQRVEE